MRTERIHELRALAKPRKTTHKSAGIILECLDEIERLTNLYCIALDVAYKGFPKRAQAMGKLKRLAECQTIGS